MIGVCGFEPTFLVGLEAVREHHGPRLAALAGRRLSGFALVRFVTAPVTGWEEDELTPAWSSADERLESFVGQELREVALLEWRPSRPDVAAGTLAVEFAFGTGRFHIANALDENSIEVGDAHPEWVRHRLGRGAQPS
ncbi:hypothetical protein ACIBK9_11305 [Nonomuraea sp. NPDC050227]|uniref:hypothetical protein n=1 Tax=Nonomuraea sp. NPDC050227 TaxID=3364360 RepID=UPI0037B420F3